MTQIRVHELASELSVSTQQVLSFLEELGKKVRGPSTVIGVSAAAKVRSRFRAVRAADARAVAVAPPVAPAPAPTRGPGVAGAPQSLFLPPVAPPPAATFPSAGSAAFANPFALPGDVAAGRAQPSRTAAAPSGQRPGAHRALPSVQPLVVAPAEDLDAWWRRGFDQAAQEMWCSHGFRPRDAVLADQCRSTGIVPTDLPRKLSGRTVLQRLRDGESTTSVWARIQEAEQQPRRAGTKLTGRFQLS